MGKRDFIYEEIARTVNSWIINHDGRHAWMSVVVRDFPASFVRIWFTKQEMAGEYPLVIESEYPDAAHENDPLRGGYSIKATILFIGDIIEITYQPTVDGRFDKIEIDLTDPDCWETLLGWMQKESLVAQSTVLTGELSR